MAANINIDLKVNQQFRVFAFDEERSIDILENVRYQDGFHSSDC